MSKNITAAAHVEDDEHLQEETRHLFGFYDDEESLEPSKFISLEELVDLVKNPLEGVEGDCPVIRIHDAPNSSEKAPSLANYWAAVLKIEIQDPSDEFAFLDSLNAFHLEGSTHQTLFFPISNPCFDEETSEKSYASSHVLVIPFDKPMDEETYKMLWTGLNTIGQPEAVSVEWLNSFPAPNENVHELNYYGDCFGTGYLEEGVGLYQQAMDAFLALKDEQRLKEPSDAAKQLCEEFVTEIKELLKLEESVQEIYAEIEVNPHVVDRIIQETIRNAVRKDEFLVLNQEEYLNNHSKKEAWPHILFNYGEPYNKERLSDLKKQHFQMHRAWSSSGGVKGYEREVTKKVHSALESLIYWHIEQHNQRSEIGYRVDMFAKNRRVELQENRAVFTLTYKPISVREDLATFPCDSAIIEDYKTHFPEFDEFLTFLVMSRFAPDRKKAYLWLHAPSDWGKGFLKSVLKNMGVCAELSVTEVESILEGKPAGREPGDFMRALCIVFDEFKKIKSELKQLENTITVIPKFKMASEVEVFGKLFLSAENVSSLVGPSGVEDQLANRFSCILGKGVLHDRALFQAKGSGEYIRHVTGYAQNYINNLVADLQQQGRLKAERKAEIFINNFHNKHGIDKVGKRLSESLEEIAEDFLMDLYQYWEAKNFKYTPFLFLNASGALCLRNGGKVLQFWMEDSIDPQEIATLRHKQRVLLKYVSRDGIGEHLSVHSPASGTSHKAILLKPLPSAPLPEAEVLTFAP